ncbi:Periplasmic nitrate reductase [Streptomyces griseoloalbus]
MSRTALRICPLCEATCGLVLTVDDGTVTRARGDRDDVFSKGFVCPKGAAFPEVDSDPDRLRTPLVRVDGELREATWEEAFDAVAAGLRGVVERHGPHAVGVVLGNPNVHTMAGALYPPLLVGGLGTHSLFTASTVDQMPKHVSSGLLFGDANLIPVPDLDRTDHLLLIGANPLESNGSLCTAPDFPGRLKALRARGGTLTVVDPRRTRTARLADRHLAVRPGTDALLLAAIARTLLDEDLADLGDAAPHIEGVAELPRPRRPLGMSPGSLAPTAAMLMFAIVYFGVMIDVGLFDPVVRGILRFCKADPMRVVVGTAVLAAIVSLDGDGSTTFMITVSAMYPLYKRLGMSLVVMTGVAAMANGVMNTVPWGGPTARAATALKLDAADIFVPMIPALLTGLLGVFGLAYVLGLRERRRLGALRLQDEESAVTKEAVLVGAGAGGGAGRLGKRAVAGAGGTDAVDGTGEGGDGTRDGVDAGDGRDDDGDLLKGLDPNRPTLRPRLYWFNALLTGVLITAMILELLPIPVLFLLGAALALSVNFPRLPDQKARIAAHADNVLNVSGMVFAAAVFTGVLQGTGMVDSMAGWLVDTVPDGLGPHMALVTGVLSLPLTYFMSNDGFYFGVLPVLTEAGAAHGVTPLEMARASLVGQPLHMSSPLVPAVYVLVGMARVEFGDHTRFVVKWAALTCLLILAAGILFGTI